MYDMKYLNDFYVSEINWAETFLFEKYESAHLATAYLSIAVKQSKAEGTTCTQAIWWKKVAIA